LRFRRIAERVHGFKYALNADFGLSRIVLNAEQVVVVRLEAAFERDIFRACRLQGVFAFVDRDAQKPGLFVLCV